MASQERGVYQPQEDFASYEDYPEEEGRSRLPLMIVIALVVVAAFGGVVYLAYNQGVQHGRAGAPPIVAAPAGPARTAPDETQTASGAPGTPYTGLKVYGEPVPPDEEAAGSALAPAATPEPAETQTAAAVPEPAPAVAPEVPIAPPPAPATPEIVVANPQPVPAPAVTAAAPPPRRPVQAQPEPLPAAQPAPPPVQVATAPAAPAAATSSGATLTGAAVLQIGSFPSEALAGAAWTRFQRAHGGAIGGLSHDVVSVQLPGKGTWYRLRVGPFPSRAAAGTKCSELKGQGASCIVAVP